MSVRVIVAGAIAHSPIRAGGAAWAFLQYVLGFRQLGCEVLYVEHLDAKDCIDATWQPAPFASSANAAAFATLVERYQLARGAAAGVRRPGPRVYADLAGALRRRHEPARPRCIRVGGPQPRARRLPGS